MQLPFADHEIADERTGMSLVFPREEYLESYLRACEESWGSVHHSYILHDPALFDEWKSTIFERYRKDCEGIDLPEGYLPSLTLWGIVDGRFVGCTNIRLRMNEKMIEYGGTLGGFITVSARGKGYGTAMGLLGLEATRRLGVEPIVTTVMESNKASLAFSEHLPYTRKDRYIAPAEGVVQPVWRYWFD
ncbi:MAG: hypothetical protein IKE61_02310 [Coriobacteriales bacterium]|nr:hypothetical protein [Coriobacteriales bacterium]